MQNNNEAPEGKMTESSEERRQAMLEEAGQTYATNLSGCAEEPGDQDPLPHPAAHHGHHLHNRHYVITK